MFCQIEQEQIKNIHKHAYAARAMINFIKEAPNLTLAISDNGMKFDITQVAKDISLKKFKVMQRFIPEP